MRSRRTKDRALRFVFCHATSLLTPSAPHYRRGRGVSNGKTDAWPPTAERPWTCWSGSARNCSTPNRRSQQIRLILSSVAGGLGADAVLWHPGATGDAPEGVGAAACRRPGGRTSWSRVLADAGGRPASCCASFLDPAARPASPWPCSAAPGRAQQVARQLAGGPELPPAPAVRAGGPQGDAAGPAAAAQPSPAGPGRTRNSRTRCSAWSAA